MPNAIDSRTPMILAHAKLTYFCGIRIVSHKDWQVVDSPIFENNQTDEVRTWARANGYYIEKFFGAPGQAWCFQRVKFPFRQGGQPPHRESSLGRMEVTT